MDLARRLEIVEAENSLLRERIAALEAASVPVKPIPIEWKLTGREQILVGYLLTHDRASKDQLHFALYGRDGEEGAEIKIIDVFVCKVRKKLAPFGVKIETLWGIGYCIDRAAREQFKSSQREAA